MRGEELILVPQQEGGETYLNTQEACDHLGVSRKTLNRYADQGRITRYRRGIKREVYFKKSELDELLSFRPDTPEDEED